MCLTALIATSLSDVMTVSRKFITEFIEMYREKSLLWKVKGKKYSDQVKKKISARNV